MWTKIYTSSVPIADDKCRLRNLWHALVQITILAQKVLAPIVTSERY